MHEDLINQIANLKQRIENERELSFTHLDMVHNVLPILKNMELALANQPTPAQIAEIQAQALESILPDVAPDNRWLFNKIKLKITKLRKGEPL